MVIQIFSVLIILFAIAVLIRTYMNIEKDANNRLLQKMLDNKDISYVIFTKYIKL